MPPLQDKPADTISDWIAFDEAYEKFVVANPMLGLGSNAWAALNLRRNFGARLLQTGAVRQLVNRRWIAHRELFGPALFELLQRAPAEILERARTRQAAGS
jgi:hypothetical protein